MRKYFSWLLALSLLGGGCAGAKKIIEEADLQPTVRVTGVRLVRLTLEQASFELALAVDNPGPLALDLSSLAWELRLEGQSAASGEAADAAHLPASGAGEVVLPITLSYPDLRAVYDRVQGQDEIGYEVAGTAGVETPLGVLRLPFRQAGRLPVVRPPRLADVRLRLDSLTLTGAALRLILRLENPNAFDLTLQRLSYQLDLAGKDFAQGGNEQPTTFPAQGSAELQLNLNLNFSKVGAWAYQLLRGSNADYSLELSAAFTGLPGQTIEPDFAQQGNLKISR